MKFKTCLLLFYVCCSIVVFGQNSTLLSFQGLNLVQSAREAALGGMARGVNDQDLNVSLRNPSLLSREQVGEVALGYAPFFDGIKGGYAAYAFESKGLVWLPSVRFFSYGEFEGRDELGREQGRFNARDLALSLGTAYYINSKWKAGANLKWLSAKYESWSSAAIATDLQLSFVNDSGLFCLSFGLDNLGVVVKKFDDDKQRLALNAFVSMSKKLAKAPFRFFFTLSQLQKWDVIPENLVDPQQNFFDNSLEEEEYNFVDQFLFHTNFGTEIVIGKNLFVRVGYNYRRREELKLPNAPGTSGVSWGAAFKVNRFKLSYARTKYHRAFASNNFSISTNLSEF